MLGSNDTLPFQDPRCCLGTHWMGGRPSSVTCWPPTFGEANYSDATDLNYNAKILPTLGFPSHLRHAVGPNDIKSSEEVRKTHLRGKQNQSN